MYESERNLYLNADKTRVVEEGDADSAYLLVARGARIPLSVAEQYGLVTPVVQGPSHDVVNQYGGSVLEAHPDDVRRVTMGAQTAPAVDPNDLSVSRAGTIDGDDNHPSKHPGTGRGDFSEADDEDPDQGKGAPAKSSDDPKEQGKLSPEDQAASDASKAKAEADTKAASEDKPAPGKRA